MIDPSDSGIDARWASEMDPWRIEALADWTATAAVDYARHGLFSDNVFALRSPNAVVTHMEGPDHIREALHA